MNTKNNLLMRIQEALAKEMRLGTSLHNLYILVNDGAVILAGSVPLQSLKVLARNIVSSVAGVELLIDDVKVAPIQSHRVGVQIDWAKGSMTLTGSYQ